MTLRSSAIPVMAVATCLAHGQSSVPSTNLVQAIVGAKIEIGDGKVIEKGNVVMRDGIIVAVGEGVAVPKGAEILDGTGLIVFPGFIDGYTTKGIKAPEVIKVDEQAPAYSEYTPSFMPSENRKGIRPDLLTAQFFQPAADALKPWQNSGFTAALAAPSGYIGGVAALMNLAGRTPAQSTLNGSVGIGFAFTGANGEGYPGSLLGVIAQVRQALADSFTADSTQRAYASGGTSRPTYDPGIASLSAHRNDWSLFDVASAAEIDRVLLMSKEFHLKPVIVGGKEAWRRVDVLKGVPVVASLGFGPEPVAKPAGKGEDETPEPADRLAERKRLYDEAVSNVKQLAAAGMLAGFTTAGSKSPAEFMDNLRVAVKAGLPRADALRALTSGPATLAGLGSRLGSINPGFIANLTVMSGDFLDAKATVKLLFIDGRRVDPTKAEIPAQRRFRFGDEEREKRG